MTHPRYPWLFLILFGMPGCTSSPPAKSEHSLAAIRTELIAMAAEDQRIRKEFVAKGVDALTPEMIERVRSIDARNTARLKEIIDVHGWPRRSQVGSEGSTAAFLLIQHADQNHAFQKSTLPMIRRAYEEDEAAGEHVAMLTDRVLVAEGKRQLYGTQAKFENGEIVVNPIQDEAEVDQRRAALGLPPLKHYIEHLRQVYGGHIQ